MIETSQSPRRRATTGIAYYARVLRVMGVVDFKARYSDAVLGYVWSLIKPLAYFGVLWLVFARTRRSARDTVPLTPLTWNRRKDRVVGEESAHNSPSARTPRFAGKPPP